MPVGRGNAKRCGPEWPGSTLPLPEAHPATHEKAADL
jgi:hypothetical protein